MKGLTQAQSDLLHFIAEYIDKHAGVSPTLEEMTEHLGCRSKGHVHMILRHLRDRGFVTNKPFCARSWTIVTEEHAVDLDRLTHLHQVCDAAERMLGNRNIMFDDGDSGTPASKVVIEVNSTGLWDLHFAIDQFRAWQKDGKQGAA
ncbi:MAG: helix-turn-helix domain-containing protein [Pseudomonadota bacterium]